MRDLFQTVFELKKQEIEMTRQQQIMKGSGLYLEALASTALKSDHVCSLILTLLYIYSIRKFLLKCVLSQHCIKMGIGSFFFNLIKYRVPFSQNSLGSYLGFK